MAKVPGAGGVFFKSPDPAKLELWQPKVAPAAAPA